ncbi:PSD1 and planctomycete cytochrome C domain-containing protein [Stieleria sp. TO1_6]|uniref:PSD1 and planctomycete cytochrome C domain-containing protein n=1 Tax=Stieleria tagensis TaxID=2956795 RepID=UPI00209B5F43|nr:PSD1 and planctomycete cytochrome C domain-containing protein [Stieleria tagensis]MCO8120213.1 PSD1 and planctomycete cytochrome C domain-containing protein [Stieleria tagensis]
MNIRLLPVLLGLLTVLLELSLCPTALADQVDFANDVRPILADTCYQCHGPDEESRAAGLRLDRPDEALAVIEPGDAAASELITRLLASDADLVMPPPDSGKSLRPEQIQTLKRWIDQGAEFQSHWAFLAPERPAIPVVETDAAIKNPIDAFVQAKLQATAITPSAPASAETLIRRLSLDLTGLPPEPALIDQWAPRLRGDGDAESANAAYAQLVNHLLSSEHFGERWARLWLDAARYADSDGYEKDKPREAWFYRDWVIRSFNQDRPYDDFIIRQIAGDLLPDATQDDRVATGFLRNSMVNEEGGADPEQFRMEAMFDRMDAVGKSILGLTIQCAQCHTHKYDPIQHEEYYGLFAYLNNTHDAIIPVYTDAQQAQADQVTADVSKLEQQIKTQIPDWHAQLIAWADQAAQRSLPQWQTPPLEFLDRTLGGSKFLEQPDGSYLCQGYAPTNFRPQATGTFDGDRLTGVRLELLTHPNLPRNGPGRSIDGTWALSEISGQVVLSGAPDKVIPMKFGRAVADRSPQVAELKPRYDNKKDNKRTTGGIDFAIDGDDATAWTNEIDTPQANQDQTAWFELAQPIEIPDQQTATVEIHLAQRHGGWNSDDNQTFNIGRFRVSLTADPIPEFAPLPIAVAALLKKPSADWSADDTAVVFSHWRTTRPELEPINQQIDSAWASYPRGTTQLTLASRNRPRTTSLLHRGEFLSPGVEVRPHVPDFLHDMQPSDAPSRLQFARWLVDRDSPTTARSIVNRIWQAYFGTGLVETSDDLGTQSSPPSHPELLDYLAVELMENGWRLKHLHRLIVGSATYQQSSDLTPELAQRDPQNRLLARAARFRVPAETVRDITLAASGLLDREVGGRSVYPPAPEFLFQPPVSYGPKVWDVARDSQRYRRALYTFRFRSVPYPMLENFDAVPGNLSCVRRSLSNTPMQALTSLNEPMFLECSIALAAKTLGETPDADDAQRIDFAFRRCTGRLPTDSERTVLVDYLDRQRQRIAAGELDPEQIISPAALLDVRDCPPDQLAAWGLLCRVIVNLDETITRE